ncbi:hypothetical protein PMIN03_011686 [Paraphaeosphaeria minitans]
MAPKRYGVPNPFPLRAQAERENARTQAAYGSVYDPPPNPMSMPYTFPPNTYPHPPVAPQPRRVHTGRLANRFNGRAAHQKPLTEPPPQFISGGSPAYPFPPPNQNTNPGPPANPYSPYPGPHMGPDQDFTYGPPPMIPTQHTDRGLPGTHGPVPANHFPSMSSLYDALPQEAPPRQPTPAPFTGPPPRPEYLIVGLFALRLTHHLILCLDPYAGSDAAVHWLEAFLRSYHTSFALAKLKDPRSIEDYVRMYPVIVRSMIKQPKYRKVFMDMDPGKKVEGRELSDGEYSDARGRCWGHQMLTLGQRSCARSSTSRTQRVSGARLCRFRESMRSAWRSWLRRGRWRGEYPGSRLLCSGLGNMMHIRMLSCSRV